MDLHESTKYQSNSNGETVLHMAAQTNYDMLKYALESTDINVNDVDNDGRTALHHLLVRADEPKSMELLCMSGADFWIKDMYDNTPIDISRIYKRYSSHRYMMYLNSKK